MADRTSELIDALELSRDALRVAREHLKSHPGYSVRVAAVIELAERDADRALARMETAGEMA